MATTDLDVPVLGISRHRIGIDGKGVTTLVAFHGCPLHCKYCLNPEALGSNEGLPRYTPASLYEKVRIDDIYFCATGGGICFGGGEPLCQVDFILKFKELCPPEWKITVETSLHVDYAALEKIAPVVDHWIIDIKAGDPEVYEKYTGQPARRVQQNLKILTRLYHVPRERITIRVPVIPGFVTEEEARNTAEKYRTEYPDVEIFTYLTEQPDKESLHKATYYNGKEKCEFLKSIRQELAEANGIEYKARECSHQGECVGTCPLCDMELEKLSQNLRNQNKPHFQLYNRDLDKLNILESDSVFDNAYGISQGFEYVKPEEGKIVPVEPIPPHDILTPGIPAPPELIREKVLFKECAVAGVSFHIKYDDEIWNELEVGTKVALVRERNNKYDKYAVAIALADDFDGDPNDFDFDFIIGYLPKSENEQIAQMLDMGWNEVFVAELTTVKRYGNINDRLRISIYIQGKEPKLVRPKLLRAESLSANELRKMTKELDERGTAYFRFGGFPHYELQYPEVGEKIVMIHLDNDSEVLYLMRVLATDEDCAQYIEDPDSIHCDDDCAPFILTNIMGPVRIKALDYNFLAGIDLKSFSATGYLPQKISSGFEKLFKDVIFKTLNRNNIDSDPSIDNPEDLE